MTPEGESAAIDWLLIDDDPVFLEVLLRGLHRRHYTALGATNAVDAIGLATHHRPARVVLDLRLGEDSGLRLLPTLRAMLPSARIIVLTGFASIATAVRAIKEGADNYLPKPIVLKDLLAAFTEVSLAGDDAHVDAHVMSTRRLEWEHISRVLVEEHNNISAAARRLGMHRRSLQRKLGKRPTR